ncbi:hypothetical protein LTR62_005039 [Meristemomyces frigidus]|uniref:Impact N-terminal domain-containing protein n=1 Tax=Meristemomyces frigidus TaxID=1508187 RepID=A0AAN7YTJ9_9PEZI|nr:hypothetical protein LTR62_005039 [Meristemomyces frigidus]
MSQKRKRDTEDSKAVDDELYRSQPLEDRQSTFVGFFSPTFPPKDLQRHEAFKSASHKMLAWRKEGTQRSLTGTIAHYDTGHDDDGEKNGGKTVLKVLEQMKVVGACVVARWYGGVMLGPVRFTHMEDCAKGAVRQWQEGVAEAAGKKRKVQEEIVLVEKLARTLGERDQSIEVLRTMAAEKEGRVRGVLVREMDGLDDGEGKGVEAGANTQESATTQEVAVSPWRPAVDYTTMSLERLQALDRAKDATLGFLLKRIAKAEKDLAALGEVQKPP